MMIQNGAYSEVFWVFECVSFSYVSEDFLNRQETGEKHPNITAANFLSFRLSIVADYTALIELLQALMDWTLYSVIMG